jgi:hypothetical protein
MRALAIALVFVLCVGSIRAQEAQTPDTASYTSPDSLRVLDSTYRARKVALDRWVREQHRDAHPQQDFISLYLTYGGYLQILARDLNQLFAERSLRNDAKDVRNNYGVLDRAFLVGAQAQLSRSWGIYTEYNLSFKYFNTQIDQDSLHRSPLRDALNGYIEDIDLTEHAFVVGGMYVIYSSPFYRLRANGAIGAVLALVSESEQTSKGSTVSSRSSSATGYQVNFDLLNDFRIMPSLSFTLDVLTRSVSTGTLKTSSDKTIDEPFGKNMNKLSIAPTATNVVYGFAAGLVYYF